MCSEQTKWNWVVFLSIVASFSGLADDQNKNHVSTTNEAPVVRTKMSLMEAATFTTPAYQKEALKLLIQEANQAATELRLPETLPISETNLTEEFVLTYGMARAMNEIGNVTTSNYLYCVGPSNKFNQVLEVHGDEFRDRLAKQYSGQFWRPSQADTNAACQLAMGWLAAASVDINAMDNDCRKMVFFMKLGGIGTNSWYMPVFWVAWKHKSSKRDVSVAYVELYLPEKRLMQLHVTETKYILRKPLEVPNIKSLITAPPDRLLPPGLVP